MYILIEFADSSIAVALHSWLESDEVDQNGFHMVAFPDLKYTKTRYMLKNKLPALTTWETVPCKVLYKHAPSQPSSLFLSQSPPHPILPLIETLSEYFGSSASVRTCFKARQKTLSSKDNEIEKSDLPISNATMRSWFQEIFTSLIRIEDTQKTLMGMVVGLSNTKSAINAPVKALKFSTSADELDSHLTYWLELNDYDRQSLVTLI
ncbi:uncharacterized protein LOC136078016 isoform X1 [Hydra vulgaris]|uniref:Uncharacterized protein LOC136078016 isoform X1 n=1 Tax=Hydra vulgaris TaxID=6087 RepID=A0ABM4BI42_HYDVU